MRSWYRHRSMELLPQPSRQSLELAIRINDELARRIAPATAASIRASNILSNPALAFLVISSILWFFLLVGVTLIPQQNFKTALQAVAAAGLGSAFSQLYAASEYIVKRTFDPKYNQIYLIRFALGLVSGIILGQFGQDLIPGSSNAHGIDTVALGLLGGFSAEVVYKLLQRFTDTLMTAVTGTGEEHAQAAAERESSQRMADTASKIMMHLIRRQLSRNRS